jgi:hypothetical protein
MINRKGEELEEERSKKNNMTKGDNMTRMRMVDLEGGV